MRDSFVFYRSWHEAIQTLPAEVQGEIYTTIIEYGLYGNETHDMGKIASAIWTLIRPQMDANRARYENGCKGAEHGKKGGAPKGNTNASRNNNGKTTPKQPLNNGKTTRNEYEYEYDDGKNNGKITYCEENPFPSLTLTVVQALDSDVCSAFERYVVSKANHGLFIDEIQQENIRDIIFRYEPPEQVLILKRNTDANWKSFVIPDEVKDKQLAKIKEEERKQRAANAKRMFLEDNRQ